MSDALIDIDIIIFEIALADSYDVTFKPLVSI